MQSGLEGKKALITGGTSGIGFGISMALAKEGVEIAVASRKPNDEAIAQIEAQGIKCHRIPVDLSVFSNIKVMVDSAIDSLKHIDIYINNAAWTFHQPVTRLDIEAWENTMNTNLRPCVFASKEIAKHMIRRKTGNIIIIGSTVRHYPAYCETSYRISKVGLKMYMENLALELAPWGIRVNMVTPGHFVTRMTENVTGGQLENLKKLVPFFDFAQPEFIGNAVAFLASDLLSHYTHGADLVIDGGLTLNPLGRKTRDEAIDLNGF
jgi:NAD(P)-dependent dehydrogenase (short-subunit alcohol dehydrogenase family)